jgi:hypothetical protein
MQFYPELAEIAPWLRKDKKTENDIKKFLLVYARVIAADYMTKEYPYVFFYYFMILNIDKAVPRHNSVMTDNFAGKWRVTHSAHKGIVADLV